MTAAQIAAVLLSERVERDGGAWSNGARDEWSTIVMNFAKVLDAQGSPAFDRRGFYEACGFNDKPIQIGGTK